MLQVLGLFLLFLYLGSINLVDGYVSLLGGMLIRLSSHSWLDLCRGLFFCW